MKKFTVIDPFNPENTVHGEIYHKNKKYGDLLILSVNGIDCNQYIHTTPKFKYPGESTSPKKVGKIKDGWIDCNVFDKLDGTNICMFHYWHEGKTYVSYKTRLTPFLKGNTFGNFLLMWQKIMERYNFDNYSANYNYGFELYGAANKILVEYKTVLDARILYKIERDTGNLTIADTPVKDEVLITEHLYYWSEVDNVNLNEYYECLLAKHRTGFLKDRSVEGSMWYVRYKDHLEILKCKPVCVVEAGSDGSITVGFHDSYTTAKNALELIDNLDELHDATVNLLLETYDKDLIDLFKDNVSKAVLKLRREVVFEKQVIKFYLSLDIKWENGKGLVMREIMKNFSKELSNQVYNCLRNYCEL